MLVILVISGAVFGAWLLVREPDSSNLVADADWMNENIWRVESYKPRKDGNYNVHLLQVEPAINPSFDELRATFSGTKYNSFNSYYLEDGVNCQGMVCYLANWCERYHCEYSVSWTKMHTLIYIKVNGSWYKFNFDVDGATIEEVLAKDVQKGMISE